MRHPSWDVPVRESALAETPSWTHYSTAQMKSMSPETLAGLIREEIWTTFREIASGWCKNDQVPLDVIEEAYWEARDDVVPTDPAILACLLPLTRDFSSFNMPGKEGKPLNPEWNEGDLRADTEAWGRAYRAVLALFSEAPLAMEAARFSGRACVSVVVSGRSVSLARIQMLGDESRRTFAL